MSSTTTSELFGSSGGTSYTAVCPANAYVTGFSGKHGSWMDSLGVTCSDGSSQGPVGNNNTTNKSDSIACAEGYDHGNVISGGFVNGVQPAWGTSTQNLA